MSTRNWTAEHDPLRSRCGHTEGSVNSLINLDQTQIKGGSTFSLTSVLLPSRRSPAAMLVAIKFIARYQTLFCCLVLIWACGIIIGTFFLTTWGSLNKGASSYPDVHQLLQKRTLLHDYKNPKIARTLKYCGPPLENGLDQEGDAIPGSRLEAVVVMMRHGDRGPLQDIHNLSSIDCGVNHTMEPELAAFARYASAHSSSRPARDPFRRFAVFPRTKSCVPGQLTERGAAQQLRVGRLLRSLYVDRMGLLPGGRWTADSVIVISTMVERTYQSAIGFLYGFLPDFDLGRLNLRVGLGANFCYSQQLCRCPRVEKLRRIVEKDKWSQVNSHPAVLSLVRQIELALQGRSVVPLHPPSTPISPDEVFDKLLVHACHRAPLPCPTPAAPDGSDSPCVTAEQVANLLSFLEWRNRQLAVTPNVRLMSRLSMQGFLTDLAQKLVDVRSQRRRHRFILYSAHDNTLMPLMTALGFADGLRPPFSSRLVFELYSSPRTEAGGGVVADGRIYHLRIVYNGRDMTDKTLFCPAPATPNTRQRRGQVAEEAPLCRLDRFVEFVRHDYLRSMNVSSFRLACAVPYPDSIELRR